MLPGNRTQPLLLRNALRVPGRGPLIKAMSPGEVFDTFRERFPVILGIALGFFVVVVLWTLLEEPEFMSRGQLLLDESGKVSSASSKQFDISGLPVDGTTNQVESILSEARIIEAILASGLNVSIAPLGEVYRPRYWEWLWPRDSGKLLDQSRTGVRVVDVKTTDSFVAGRKYTVKFKTENRYEVWLDGRLVGSSSPGEPLALPELSWTLVASTRRSPKAGTWYEVVPTHPQDQVEGVREHLQVFAPKALNAKQYGRVVVMTFMDWSPDRAVTFLRALMDSYLQQVRTLNQADAAQTEELAAEQVGRVRELLDATEQQLSALRSQSADILRAETEGSLIGQLGAQGAKRAELQRQEASLAAMEKTVMDSATGTDSYLLGDVNDSVLSGLVGSLSRDQENLASLEPRFEANAPQLKQQREQIAANAEMIRNYVAKRRERASQQLGSMHAMDAQFENRLKALPGIKQRITQLTDEREVLGRIYADLLKTQKRASISKALTTSSARILDKPSVSSSPKAPDLGDRLPSVLLGLLFGLEFVLLQRLLASRVLSEHDVRRYIGALPILARVPRLGRLARNKSATDNPLSNALGHGQSAFAEAFRLLRANLSYPHVSRTERVVLVTSPTPGEGKTTCAASLAVTLAAGSKRVLIIDADMYKRRSIWPAAETNLSNVLSNEYHWIKAVRNFDFPGGRVHWIAAGRAPIGSAEMLSSALFSRFMAEVREHYDFVVIDAPSYPLYSDALVMSTEVDRVLSVVRLGHTSTKDLEAHVSALANSPTFCAIVLNECSVAADPSEARDGLGASRDRLESWAPSV